jgi:methionyl-tRNA synthetase
MDDFFYITTPIYYVNAEPHIGNAYPTILADVLARFARLRGRPTFFLTGVDEHGQKVQNAARQLNLDPQVYVDEMAQRWQETWKRLNISYDDFIRTTQPRHVRVVQHVLQDLWQRGEIYRGEYAGWYCVADERFWTEKDLVNGLCPECGRPVERLVEANYFFRMSAYQDWLVDYIHTHPDFVRPEWRRNEVLGFLRKPLEDLCISRPASRLSWGIPLPFDPAYVTYVWFDALLNYVTAAGYLQESSLPQASFETVWPNAMHLIGLEKIFDALTAANQYLENTSPWKTGDAGRVGTILYTACEALRLCSVLLAPVMPGKAAEVWQRLGWQPPEPLANGLAWGGLQPVAPVSVGEPLFPRTEEVRE